MLDARRGEGPPTGLAIGDPAGIGPEIASEAALDLHTRACGLRPEVVAPRDGAGRRGNIVALVAPASGEPAEGGGGSPVPRRDRGPRGAA